MTREEFKAIPKRDWKEDITDVYGVYILPSGRKHESGWAIMDFVAVKKDGNKIGFGDCCDDIVLEGSHFRIDCDHPSRLLHIWNRYGFTVKSGLSSISLVENDRRPRWKREY